MRLILGLLFFLSFSALSLPKDKDCENHLTGALGEAQAAMVELFKLRGDVEQRLYPHADPLANAITQEDAHQIVEFLSRLENGSGLSVLGEARQLMRSKDAADVQRLTALAKKTAQAAAGLLRDQRPLDESGRENLQRVTLATEVVLSLLQKAAISPSAQQQQKPEDNQQDDQNSKKSQKAPEPQPGQEAPPTYPQSDEDPYKVHTKNTDSPNSGKKQESFVAVEINRPDIYFLKTISFAGAQLKKTGLILSPQELPMQAAFRPKAPRAGGLQSVFHIQGQEDAVLLIPPGFEPHQPDPASGASVYQTSSGQFRIKNSKKLQNIKLALSKSEDEINPLKLEMLSMKVLDVPQNQWPDKIRDELFPVLNPKLALDSMRKIESFVAHQFLYSVDARAEVHPFDAIKAGAFQCDMAAAIGLILARDVLGLPAQVAAGYKTHKPVSDPSKTVLRLPTDAHAVLEVFINGKWELFDLTPRRKDRNKEDGQKDENFQDSNKDVDDTFAKPEQEKPDSDSKDKAKDKSKDKSADKDKAKDKEKANAGKGDKTKDKAETAEEMDAKDQQLERELESALRLGSLSLKPDRVDGVLTARARRILFKDALHAMNDTQIATQRLQPLRKDVRDEREYKSLLNRADIALVDQQPSVPDSYIGLAAHLRSRSLVETFKRLVQMEDRLLLHIQLSDAQEAQILRDNLADLRAFKKEISRLSSDRKLAIAMAEKFLNGLPAHSRRLVRDTYKIDNLDQNPGTQSLLKDLKAAKLQDFNLLRLLYPLTNFVMDSTPTPAFATRKTLFEDSRNRRGRDWVPLEDMSRSRDAILEEPHQSLHYNIQQGMARVQSRKRQVDVPAPFGKTTPKRVTIVNYDTSGSMNGDAGDFQAALIAAFVDRALSDINGDGRHNHTCALLGFDDKVHKVTTIKDSDDAYRVIRNFRKEMANTSGGTNIMTTLEESFAQIYSAQKANNNEPLASANIILMSDGQSEINFERLAALMAKVHKKTPVKFMFVAINGENEQLYELAMRSRQLGAEAGFYHSFPSDKIKDFLAQSRVPPGIDTDRELYTESKPDALSKDFEQRLSTAGMRLGQDLQGLQVSQTPQSLAAWLNQLELLSIIPFTGKETQLGAEIRRFRGIALRSAGLQDQRKAALVVDDLLKNLPKLTGKTLRELNVNEVESLKHLVNWALRVSRSN